jgi:hypothetical protein
VSRILAVLQRLRDCAARVPDLESPYPLHSPAFGPPCCDAEIDELLGSAASRVSEYVEFLRLCRRIDASDVFNGYFLYSPVAIAASDGSIPRILQVDLGRGLDEVFVLRIGGDGGGNQFVMGTGKNAPGTVWKWNHEHPVRFDGMAKEGLSQVATSFSAFLERMAEDWEHFVDRDRSWTYLSG